MQGVLGELRSVVDGVAGFDPAGLSDVALADDLLRLRREMDRLDGVFARLAAAGHRRGVGAVDGAQSTAAWLRGHAGMREGDAKAAIQAGRVCELLEETGAAWRAGEITTGAARTIASARVKGHDDKLQACETAFLALARDRDLRGLRAATARFRSLAHDDDPCPSDKDGLYLSKTYDDRAAISGSLGDTAAETFATALSVYTDPPGESDPRTPAQRRAAALTKICEVALAHAGDAGRTPKHVSYVINHETLMDSRLGRCEGEFTGPIHPDSMRRLLCDCTVSRIVTGPDSLPMDVGRARRSFPAAMRRAIVVRDGGCRFPRCDRPPGWCEAHHVIHVCDGGPTSLDNGVLYCSYHHHVVHKPGWHETFHGNELHIYRPNGTEVT